jgi:hypothetical protein
MKLRLIPVVILSFLLSTVAYSAPTGSGKLYRYKDDNGVVVIRSILPSEQIKHGYEILDRNGKVIKVIPSESEIASQQESVRKKKEQDDYDLSLLRRYSFVKDIEEERRRKITELSNRLNVLKGNLTGVRAELENAYVIVADSERGGKEVDPVQKKRIQKLEEQITVTEQQIKHNEEDIRRREAEYARAMVRFRELQAIRAGTPEPAPQE